MTPLQTLESEILGLHERLSLRPTLDLARQIGERLKRAKALMPHGQWIPWLRRCTIARRTAATYMQISNEPTTAHISERLSIEQFLAKMRTAKRAGCVHEREEARREMRDRIGQLPEAIQVHHADAATFPWPPGIEIVASDPPWKDLDAYRTLAKIARESLRPGGLVLAQCGVSGLANILDVMREGLTYQHVLSVTYSQAQGGSLIHPWQSNWRPVVVMSRGDMVRKGLPVVSDVFTVGGTSKAHHLWEQPVQPWAYWLSRLADPGQLVCDPFMGSGTIGEACKGAGLRYIGTEIDEAHYEVARGRLLE
jgi:hypothetical protein